MSAARFFHRPIRIVCASKHLCGLIADAQGPRILCGMIGSPKSRLVCCQDAARKLDRHTQAACLPEARNRMEKCCAC